MLLLPVLPHPFGQIEPFRSIGWSDNTIGIVLVTGSLVALFALYLGRYWHIQNPRLRFIRRVILIMPQQMIITYIAYASCIEAQHAIETLGLASDMASRSIFSLNISATLATVHAIGTVRWLSDPRKWKSHECAVGPNSCPYKKALEIQLDHLPEPIVISIPVPPPVGDNVEKTDNGQ